MFSNRRAAMISVSRYQSLCRCTLSKTGDRAVEQLIHEYVKKRLVASGPPVSDDGRWLGNDVRARTLLPLSGRCVAFQTQGLEARDDRRGFHTQQGGGAGGAKDFSAGLR